MKKTLFIILFLIGFTTITYTQNISCQELYEYIVDNHRTTDAVTCSGSFVLVKVHYYNIESTGYVVAYIKQNNYDMRGKPYIYCGISTNVWRSFRSEGLSSWGKTLNKYITRYNCN